jgi:eukaryotic-like serine/threonine-protein kinase
MSQSDDDRLSELFSAVADGRAVDWAALLAATGDDRERGLIAQLQVLERVRSGGGPEPVDPRMWGPLEVLEELGRGAYGRVFRARDPHLDREVALKMLDGQAVTEGRFLREAQILARIRHPHIVAVHGADEFDGVSGIWMELVRGRSLEAIVREQGAFGAREAALIGIDLCAALAAVHGAGLRHRDIKAHNVMRELGGRIVLMDFGAGRLSHASTDAPDPSVTGTPAYMAPEFFKGAPATVATDLYALGVLLFLLTTGEYPVTGATIGELRDAHGRGSRRRLREARPDTPALFAQVVDRALSPDPAGRFLTAAEMEQALAATLQVGYAVLDQPEGAHATGWRAWVARPLPAWALVGALGIAIPTAFMIGIGRGNGSTRETAATGAHSTTGSPGSPIPLSAEQWDTIDAEQELASMLADRGDWT